MLYIFNYMDRTNISYAQLGMQHELGITAATFGVAASIFFLAYVVFEIPSNMALKRYGARIWLARIAITWGHRHRHHGLRQQRHPAVRGADRLRYRRAGLYPGLLLYLTFWFRQGERGRAIAAMALAQPIAMILGSFTGGLILDHITWFDLSGWRWVFILQGAPTILLGIVALKQQLAAIKNPRILHPAVANLFAACGLYGFTFFLPQIIVTIGLYFPIGCLVVSEIMLALVKVPAMVRSGESAKEPVTS